LSTSFRHFNVRLKTSQWERLSQLAADRGVTQADVLRDAVDTYLAAGDLLTASHRRIARLIEFVQIAVDLLIREQYPEYSDRILAEADRRLEQYHGA